MADWASKPIITILFSQSTILYSLRNIKVCIGGGKKFTDYYGHECEKTFGMPLVLHRAKLVPGMLKTGLFPVFCHPVSYCEVLPARFVTLACFSLRYQTYRKIHSVHGLSLFYSKHCNISFLFPRCVYRCA